MGKLRPDADADEVVGWVRQYASRRHAARRPVGEERTLAGKRRRDISGDRPRFWRSSFLVEMLALAEVLFPGESEEEIAGHADL